MGYHRDEVKAPRVSGLALQLFVGALESRGAGGLLLDKLLADSGVERFRRAPVHAPPTQPDLPHPGVDAADVLDAAALGADRR